jgi:hypothetical protein
LPIGEKTKTWYNYFSIQSNQIKAKELLDPFRKKLQMIILIAPNYIGRDNTPVTIPRLVVG